MRIPGKPLRDPLEPEDSSPLNAAISKLDQDTMSMVRHALQKRDVLLAFQPIVRSCKPDRPAFYEGLIRVLDVTGRIIPARDFMGTVETSEEGRLIDCISLEMGLDSLNQDKSLRLAINMSARSIAYPQWMRTLRRGLKKCPTAAERLILEISEESAMIMPDTVEVFMKGLQRHGISFALDDFGAGTTSFKYLRQFYFDFIKIDGQFIRGIAYNADNQCMTAALLSIAQHFDMHAVAESVETARDAMVLQEMGVDCMQGYYFGAPTVTPPWKAQQATKRA
jgi:EAL domain-containing protein (putative c-di-GMP-specific phosphodiesterase class I)